MHKTNTVDYAVVYDGEIWLELDDAKTVISRKAMSSSRRYSARMAKQRYSAGDHVVLFERRERVSQATLGFARRSKHSGWCIVTFIGSDRQNATQ